MDPHGHAVVLDRFPDLAGLPQRPHAPLAASSLPSRTRPRNLLHGHHPSQPHKPPKNFGLALVPARRPYPCHVLRAAHDPRPHLRAVVLCSGRLGHELGRRQSARAGQLAPDVIRRTVRLEEHGTAHPERFVLIMENLAFRLIRDGVPPCARRHPRDEKGPRYQSRPQFALVDREGGGRVSLLGQTSYHTPAENSQTSPIPTMARPARWMWKSLCPWLEDAWPITRRQGVWGSYGTTYRWRRWQPR